MQLGMTSLASLKAGEIISQDHTQNELIIISGQSGAGKSTWCQDLIDIKTNERRLLAKRKQLEWDCKSCNWDFDERACAWANQVLREASSAEVLFIDELGPRELLRGEGFQEGVRLLDEGRYESAFVVVRPQLLTIARQRWPNLQLIHLHKKAL